MDTDITVSDLESLRKRFQLVGTFFLCFFSSTEPHFKTPSNRTEGDRKAYVQTFEHTKQQNDDRIREIRVANQELRSRIAEKKKKTKMTGTNFTNSEVENLTRQLHRLRASHDKYRHRSQNMRIELQGMEDKLR